MLTLPKIIADFEVSLAASVSVGQTTATLSSITDKDGNTIPNGVYCFTLDRNSSSKKEHIIATVTGTALSSISSVNRQGTTTSGFARSHRLGANVIISDYAVLKRILDNVDGTTGFNSLVKLGYDADPSINSSDLNKFATVKFVNDTAIAGAPDATEATKGITRLSTAPVSPTAPIAVGDNDPRVPTTGENDALQGTSGTPSNTNRYVTNDDTATTTSASKVVRANGSGKIDNSFIDSQFSGTGADGALTISSGTTNIDLGGAPIFVRNYTSISITGTGALTFTNPATNGTIIVLKSQGNVTITSNATVAIDVSGLGGQAVAQNLNGNYGNGTLFQTNAGLSGSTSSSIGQPHSIIVNGFIKANCGASGGGGAQSTGIGATSGAGGGVLIVQCAGSLNFGTGATIRANGNNALSNAGNRAGGGGGGAGGCVALIYNTLTANLGTIQANGGNGSNGGTDALNTGSTGGAGGANRVNGGAGGLGSSPADGVDGQSDMGTGGAKGLRGTPVGGGGGGGGAGGYYFVQQNINIS